MGTWGAGNFDSDTAADHLGIVTDRWKATYLAVWDRKIDALAPKPDHKVARRAALIATFDELAVPRARR